MADAYPKYEDGEHDLHLKCMYEDAATIKEAVAAGAPVNYTAYDLSPLIAACKSGQIEVALELLKLGADPNLSAHGGVTALPDYAWKYPELVKALLEKGAKPDAIGQQDYTALQQALNEDRAEVAVLIIEAGIDVNRLGDYDQSPLMMAVSRRNIDVIRALKKCADLDLNYKREGKTALDMARENMDTEIIEILN
jgi:ankyrin repeat protein